ncbi:hypothetical protein [Salipaludibacillus neizhouensis]|nr:hypothetical protein [Salipaludibacillus neizhouensis]
MKLSRRLLSMFVVLTIVLLTACSGDQTSGEVKVVLLMQDAGKHNY